MHPGAVLLSPQFPEYESARRVLAEVDASDWKQSIPDGPFKTEGWRVIPLVKGGKRQAFVDRHAGIGRALDFFQDPVLHAVLYSMLPGAEVHLHRDVPGSFGLGSLKFHVPLETNPGVTFQVGREDFAMKAGELWALNTSYIHGVRNHGTTERVHLVVTALAGEWSRSMLPKRNLRFYGHNLCFAGMILWRAVSKLLTDRSALRKYSGMTRFMVKRLLNRQAV